MNLTSKIKSLPVNQQGNKIIALPAKKRTEVLKGFTIKEFIEMIDFLDPLKANTLVKYLSKVKRTRVLKLLTQNVQQKLKLLIKLNSKNIAPFIDFNYVQIDHDLKVKDTTKIISAHEKVTGKDPTVLVTNDGYLIGEVPVKNLIHAKKNDKLKKIIKKLPQVNFADSDEKIIKTFKKHPRGKVVILNENQSILGVTYSSDILSLIDNQKSKSLNKFAGLDDEESIIDPILSKVEHRYKWLIVNLFTAFMAAFIVGIFEPTISKTAVLAAYLPIVAGMGGNAATQTFAVTVRGIALNQINVSNIKSIVKRESIAGILNGLITGLIATAVAVSLGQTPLLGIILALAMVFNLFIAGFFGATIPILMNKLGKDPASSATILITTATDIFGFLSFLTLATLIIH